MTPRDADSPQVGRLAIASGSPCDQTWARTRGLLSPLGRTLYASGNPCAISEVSRTDAAIDPGNSGRPLLDHEGRAMGMKTRILSRDRPSEGDPQYAGERSQHWFNDPNDGGTDTPQTEALALSKGVWQPPSQPCARRPQSRFRPA